MTAEQFSKLANRVTVQLTTTGLQINNIGFAELQSLFECAARHLECNDLAGNIGVLLSRAPESNPAWVRNPAWDKAENFGPPLTAADCFQPLNVPPIGSEPNPDAQDGAVVANGIDERGQRVGWEVDPRFLTNPHHESQSRS